MSFMEGPLGKYLTSSITCLIRPMLAGLQQLSPIPCQITTGTGASNFSNINTYLFVYSKIHFKKKFYVANLGLVKLQQAKKRKSKMI